MDVVDIACKIILITSTFFADGNRPSQEPLMATGQAKNRHVDNFRLRVAYCTVVAIWIYLVIYNWFSCIRTFLRART